MSPRCPLFVSSICLELGILFRQLVLSLFSYNALSKASRCSLLQTCPISNIAHANLYVLPLASSHARQRVVCETMRFLDNFAAYIAQLHLCPNLYLQAKQVSGMSCNLRYCNSTAYSSRTQCSGIAFQGTIIKKSKIFVFVNIKSIIKCLRMPQLSQ